MAHSLQARTDLIRQAVLQGSYGEGTPGNQALAQLVLLDRDIAALEQEAASVADGYATERTAGTVTTSKLRAVQINADRDRTQLEQELKHANATIAELRIAHARKLGEIGGTINEYHRQLDALAHTLLGHA